jgi:hypothetical protein
MFWTYLACASLHHDRRHRESHRGRFSKTGSDGSNDEGVLPRPPLASYFDFAECGG